MQELVSVLCLASIVCLIVGWKNPNAFKFLFKERTTPLFVKTFFGSTALLLFVLFVIISPKDKNGNIIDQTSPPTPEQQTIALSPTPTQKPTIKPVSATSAPVKSSLSPMPTQNTGRVTLDSLAVVLVPYNISQSNGNYNGFSNQNTVSLQGDKNNIKTIMFSFNNQKPSDIENNSMFIESILQAVLPTWKGSNIWLGNALTQFSNSTDPEGNSAETDVDNKHILLGYAPVNSSLNLTITIK
jgi:hypothetical protein